jgi:hydrogenase expression/formation protein HypE
MEFNRIMLDHGSGGQASAWLVERVFVQRLGTVEPDLEDAAVVALPAGPVALSTDGYVVTPLFFPGGDIGDLAVNGTVNDLAMRGATPLYLTASFILEEGLPIPELERVVDSMAAAAAAAGVRIAAGDTKVVPRGSADRMFVTTSGVGVIGGGINIHAGGARPDDLVLVNGSIGDHGLAVMCVREGLFLDAGLESDTAPLNGLVEKLIEACGTGLRVLRDPTRGGVAASLNEIAAASGVSVEIDEEKLPLNPAVQGACDLLGLDPLYAANEGKCLIVVHPDLADAALNALWTHPLGRQAAIVGRVGKDRPGRVFLKTRVGGARILDMPAGRLLPRIC